jgi:hypothetical protein
MTAFSFWGPSGKSLYDGGVKDIECAQKCDRAKEIVEFGGEGLSKEEFVRT